jgi:hypothetical protein
LHDGVLETFAKPRTKFVDQTASAIVRVVVEYNYSNLEPGRDGSL